MMSALEITMINKTAKVTKNDTKK